MKERRQFLRRKTLRRGTILFNGAQSSIDCILRNLSDSGACLEVASPVGCPPSFDLRVAGSDVSQTCDLAWQAGNRIGVSFRTSVNELPLKREGAEMRLTSQNSTPAPSTTDLVRNELLALRSALDEVPYGVVLLDAELRAQFINRAFRKMWRLTDDKADKRPAFVALMYHGRDTRAYEMPEDNLDHYISDRVAHVKAGTRRPLDLRLASGEVLRFQCTPLPAGGRMLMYTYVTDIVRHSDELEELRAALDEVDEGIILLDAQLNVRIMNRAVRALWHVSDEQAESHPPYAQLVNEARTTGTYGVPDGELDDYISNRIKGVRAGDPTPFDLRHSDGRTIRSQCTVLPNGGRMLTYSDITDLVRHAEELQHLATTDGLTGLYNRRHFLVLAESEWSRFQRYNRPLSLLIFDIDNFKTINDSFGHDVGDRAIQYLADICREGGRASDIFARFGGDEFAALLPETSLKQAHIVAERLRLALLQKPFLQNGSEVITRISVGAAEARLSMAGTHVLIKCADQALYKAKAAGRDQTVLASPHEIELRIAAE